MTMFVKIMTVFCGLALAVNQANASNVGSIRTALHESDLLQEAFGPFGGTGGSPFSDADFGNRTIASVDLRSASKLDSIRMLYAGAGPQPNAHGGTGGSFRSFNLELGERITAVNIRSGTEIDAIQFVTSAGRLSRFFGGNGGSLSTVNFGAGGLRFISGRAGSRVNQLTFQT